MHGLRLSYLNLVIKWWNIKQGRLKIKTITVNFWNIHCFWFLNVLSRFNNFVLNLNIDSMSIIDYVESLYSIALYRKISLNTQNHEPFFSHTCCSKPWAEEKWSSCFFIDVFNKTLRHYWFGRFFRIFVECRDLWRMKTHLLFKQRFLLRFLLFPIPQHKNLVLFTEYK